MLASLNHPNIAHIHGLEDGEAGPFLVMELVDGPTLADRIAQGPIPIDEALAIARQIADALEAAHERGIIHRDLKPANIKVSDDGAVKVLDFGLAKALDPGRRAGIGIGERANSPTITTPAMTQAGLILGTAAYMSPEQAKGRVVDKRSDVWAFGCVLYEMLTGAARVRRRRRHRHDRRGRARRAGLVGAAAGHAAADSAAAEAMSREGSARAHLRHRRGAVPDERDDCNGRSSSGTGPRRPL